MPYDPRQGQIVHSKGAEPNELYPICLVQSKPALLVIDKVGSPEVNLDV